MRARLIPRDTTKTPSRRRRAATTRRRGGRCAIWTPTPPRSRRPRRRRRRRPPTTPSSRVSRRPPRTSRRRRSRLSPLRTASAGALTSTGGLQLARFCQEAGNPRTTAQFAAARALADALRAPGPFGRPAPSPLLPLMREISVRNKISSIARTVIFENLIAPAIRYYGPHKARKAFAVFAFPLRSLRQNVPYSFFQRKVRKEF